MKGRERKNKEKKKQQKQIQLCKDSVNSRYEINHTAQPHCFVVLLCNTCKASSYAYKFRQ